MLAEQPLTLDAMATMLGVARSSVSTNIRVSVRGGMVDRVSFPGDRRDYYRWAADTWDSAGRVAIESLVRLRRVAERGLTAMAPDDEVARARLAELIDYCEFMTAEQQASLARWRERRGTAAEAAVPALDGIGRQL
jgi:DNA-binding transcriptional regulator GbsR (MarR family)